MQYLLLVLLFSIQSTLCKAEDYICQTSIDGKQSFRRDAEEVQIFIGHAIDTSLLHTMAGDNEYWTGNIFHNIIKNTSDTATLVIKIDGVMKGEEGEYILSLFGEFQDRRITKLYLVEAGEITHYWRLTESAFSLGCDCSHTRVELTAVMKVVSFFTSGSIDFPFNEKGLYDYDVNRYLIVKCGFTIPDELVKFFPPTFEP